MEHDIHSEGATETGGRPVEVAGVFLLEAMLHNEDPDPERREEATRKNEAVANAGLDTSVSKVLEYMPRQVARRNGVELFAPYFDCEPGRVQENAEQNTRNGSSNGRQE